MLLRRLTGTSDSAPVGGLTWVVTGTGAGAESLSSAGYVDLTSYRSVTISNTTEDSVIVFAKGYTATTWDRNLNSGGWNGLTATTAWGFNIAANTSATVVFRVYCSDSTNITNIIDFHKGTSSGELLFSTSYSVAVTVAGSTAPAPDPVSVGWTLGAAGSYSSEVIQLYGLTSGVNFASGTGDELVALNPLSTKASDSVNNWCSNNNHMLVANSQQHYRRTQGEFELYCWRPESTPSWNSDTQSFLDAILYFTQPDSTYSQFGPSDSWTGFLYHSAGATPDSAPRTWFATLQDTARLVAFRAVLSTTLNTKTVTQVAYRTVSTDDWTILPTSRWTQNTGEIYGCAPVSGPFARNTTTGTQFQITY